MTAYHQNQKVTMKSTGTQSGSMSELFENMTTSIDTLTKQLEDARTQLTVQRRKIDVLVSELKTKDWQIDEQLEELRKRSSTIQTFSGKEHFAQAYQQDLKEKITDTKAKVVDLEVTVKSKNEEIQTQSKRIKFFKQVTSKLRKENDVLSDELTQAVGTQAMKQLRSNMKLKMVADDSSDFDRSKLMTEG